MILPLVIHIMKFAITWNDTRKLERNDDDDINNNNNKFIFNDIILIIA